MRDDALGSAAVYVGAVVGAGFGTGREILHFFAAYGSAGLYGCLLAGLAFAWLGARVLSLAAEGSTPEYGSLYALALGDRLAGAADWLTTVFLFIGLGVALAGAGEIGREAWGAPLPLGAGAMAAIVLAIAWFGRSGLIWGNLIMVPPLILAAGALATSEAGRPGFWTAIATAPALGGRMAGAWPVGATMYVGYNVMLGSVALCTAGRGQRPRSARAGGIVGGLALGTLAALVVLPLLAHGAALADVAVPLARVAASYGQPWGVAYVVCLALALTTTALATVTALAGRVAGGHHPHAVTSVALLAALPVATLGLVRLIGTAYPAMGALGLLLCIGLAIRAGRNSKE